MSYTMTLNDAVGPSQTCTYPSYPIHFEPTNSNVDAKRYLFIPIACTIVETLEYCDEDNCIYTHVLGLKQ